MAQFELVWRGGRSVFHDRLTLHVDASGPASVIAHVFPHFVVAKDLIGAGFTRHEEQKVPEFGEAEGVLVLASRKEGHEIGDCGGSEGNTSLGKSNPQLLRIESTVSVEVEFVVENVPEF